MTKIVATADTHFPLKWPLPEGDVLAIAGDFLYAGTEREWYPRLEALASHRDKYKEILFVPGNHDLYFQYYAGTCIQELKKIGVTALTPTKPVIDLDGIRFGSCPYVTNLPNWAYNSDEEYIWAYLDSLARVDVMISHSPPRGVLDSDGRQQFGLGALRKYIARYQPQIVICGHIHEGYGTQVIGRTHVYNSSMCNTKYEQVNPPHVIEV